MAIVAVGVYFFFFTPRAQAQRTADHLMHSAYEQNEEAFRRHADPSSSSLYATASQRNYRLEALTQDATTFFALYMFTDSQTPSHARITLEDGIVTAAIAGNSLGTTPRSDPQTSADDTISAAQCLAEDDLAPLDARRLYARTIRGVTMIFGDDSATNYVNLAQSDDLLDRMATFYENTNEKDYSFLVRGYLPTASDEQETRQQIIDNRTTKIQQDLTDRGVTRDRITIGRPIAYDASLADETHNGRYIVIDVVNNCID